MCGPLDNQVWATAVVRKGSVRQPRVEMLSGGSQSCWSDRDREGVEKGKTDGRKGILRASIMTGRKNLGMDAW